MKSLNNFSFHCFVRKAVTLLEKWVKVFWLENCPTFLLQETMRKVYFAIKKCRLSVL